VETAVQDGSADSDAGLLTWHEIQVGTPAGSFARRHHILSKIHLGLEALVLARLWNALKSATRSAKLPNISALLKTQTKLVGSCLATFLAIQRLLADSMPTTWWQRPRSQGSSVREER